MSDGFKIKVDPATLRTKADEVDRLLGKMTDELNTLYKIVNKTGGYWIGTASDNYKTSYNQEKDAKLQPSLEKMKSYPKKLREMAGLYDSGERKNVRRVTSLNEDVIL